ncbi:MAG: nitroreductase family protein [Oscillospiraceae bacterium]|nr:nitroreductase family protein [Oscillospiraceae bacterium]
MREAILNRISRRSFRQTPIAPELRGKICDEIDEINRESGLAFTFVENAGEAFCSMPRSYGMFSGVRSVVVLKGAADLPDLAEKTGYYGERLMLDLTDMGLGTCWVGGTFDRGQFEVPGGETMLCVMPVGYVAEQTAKEKLIRSALSRRRRPVSRRLVGYENAPGWVLAAMEAVRLAPSAVNSQKPVFTCRGGTVTAAVEAARTMDLIDLGIAKLHFAVEAGGRFEFGQNGKLIKD